MSAHHGMRDARLPLAPLWDLLERKHRPRVRPFGPMWKVLPFGVDDFAEAVGCSRRAVHRWRHAGLTWDAADRAAVAVGLHPANVWGREWWASVPVEDVA